MTGVFSGTARGVVSPTILSPLDRGADALRRYEQRKTSKNLCDWSVISDVQKDHWRKRTFIVLQATGAVDYDDDVTPEAIAQLRAEADEILSKGEWTTIKGSVARED